METQFETNAKKDRSQLTMYLSNPQRWNGYSYALNNPSAYVDQDGFDPVWVHNLDTNMYFSVSEEEYNKNYAGKNGYEQVTNTGPDGFVFQLNQLEWSYANDSGSNVYLGTDGRFHAAPNESNGDPPSDSGYLDINFASGPLLYGTLGLTGGVMFGNNGGVSPYLGGGAMSPNPSASASYSPVRISGGLNWQIQVVPGMAYGQDEEGNSFREYALGSPSASATAYYVFNAPHLFTSARIAAILTRQLTVQARTREGQAIALAGSRALP